MNGLTLNIHLYYKVTNKLGAEPLGMNVAVGLLYICLSGVGMY